MYSLLRPKPCTTNSLLENLMREYSAVKGSRCNLP
jgi:hypothetical protein